MTNLLVYTPTYDNLLRPETVASVVSQKFDGLITWEIGRHNPYPAPDMRNVVWQYQRARQMCLDGGYDALLTVEHDMVLPIDTVQTLYNTDAAVVYAPYMLRHGTKTLSVWHYCGDRNLGMSLSLYPDELKRLQRAKVGRVCGVGWGCTLIRREVLERIQVRGSEATDAGDIAFAVDCLRAGIAAYARFDVPCGHFDGKDGALLETTTNGGVVGRVLALADVTVSVNGQSQALKKGRYYTLPLDNAQELARAGYVQITNEERETADAPPVTETAVPPAAKRKPKAKAK